MSRAFPLVLNNSSLLWYTTRGAGVVSLILLAVLRSNTSHPPGTAQDRPTPRTARSRDQALRSLRSVIGSVAVSGMAAVGGLAHVAAATIPGTSAAAKAPSTTTAVKAAANQRATAPALRSASVAASIPAPTLQAPATPAPAQAVSGGSGHG